MANVVTLDFHNTLARCDAWFELEVRELLPRFLAWQAARRGAVLEQPVADDAAATYRELRREIIEHGRELTAEQCVAVVLERVGQHATAVEISEGVERLMRAAMHDLAPMPGAIDLVTTLRSAGVTLGVVSSAVYHPFIVWSLASFGISDAFASVVTSASAGYYKSRTEIYTHALSHLGAEPGQSVHIGDSWRWDTATAQQAGMMTAWLNPHGAGSEVTPDLELHTLVDAAPAILALFPSALEKSA